MAHHAACPTGRDAGAPRLTATLRDLSGRGRAAESAERLARQNRQVLEAALEGIFGIGADGRVTFVNPAAARMLGWPAAELVGSAHQVMLGAAPEAESPGGATTRAARTPLHAAVADGRVREVDDDVFRRRDGGTFRVGHVTTPLWQSGRFAGAVVVFKDATDRRQSEWLEQDRRRFLELVARGRPLPDALHCLVRMLERQRPGLRACVTVLRDAAGGAAAGANPGGARLVRGAASAELGQDFLAALEEIGGRPDARLALHGREAERVTATEPAGDPLWENHLDVAARHGVEACWSARVLAADGRPLGLLWAFPPGSRRPVSADLQLLETAAGMAAVAIEQGAAGERLAQQALHDPLTGLPNRTLMEDRLRQTLARARRVGGSAAVFLVGFDGLKDAPDAALRELSKRMQAGVRQSDTLARAGDEFVFIAADLSDRRDAAIVGDKLLAMLGRPVSSPAQDSGDAPAGEPPHELPVTAGVGVAVFPHDGADADALLRSAGAALGRARGRGGSRIEFFSADTRGAPADLERLDLESHLRHAVEKRELELHYQPQVDWAGRPVGLEALVRWNHPRLGQIPPARFIPLAEESGLILPVGQWVMREACRQARAWQREWSGPEAGRAFVPLAPAALLAPRLAPLRVAVNVSALQFAQENFVRTVESALADAGLDPCWLELEITESLLMRDAGGMVEKLNRLREMGVGVAIDDFGTGYSSLAYLQRLPIDTLKIDRTFVQDLGRPAAPPTLSATAAARRGPGRAPAEDGNTAVIRAVLGLARSLGMGVVAEGVETERQRQFLVQHGCHFMQGYLFSKPLPAADVPAALRAMAGAAEPEAARPIPA